MRLPCLTFSFLSSLAHAFAFDYDVVIVGAGYAGLAASHALVSANVTNILVLEAASRVGGRTRNFLPSNQSYDITSDSVVELGGTFVAPSHTALINFASAMGVAVYNTSGTYALSRVRPRMPSLAEPADRYPWWYWGVDTEDGMAESVFHTEAGVLKFRSPEELKSLLKGMPVFDELEAVGKLMAAAVGQVACEAADEHWEDLDGITFEAWIRQHVSHPEGRNVLRAMNRGMIAQEPSQVSFLSTAKSLKGCWSAGDDDQYRLRGGSQAPLLEAARRLGGRRLKLGAAVLSVQRVPPSPTPPARSGEAGGPRFEVSTQDGTRYRAANVILTGSPPALLGIRAPDMGANDAQLLQRMPMGESAKLFFFYDEPWWRDEGKSANVMSTSGYSACMDHSSKDASHGSAALMCWLEGQANLHFFGIANRTQALEEVLAFLEASLGDPRVRSYRSHVCLDWPQDPYARGAYTGFFTPGVQSQPAFWKAYANAEKVEGLFVAGADYMTGLGNGYMEGAVRSGQAAAETILGRLANTRQRQPAIARGQAEMMV